MDLVFIILFVFLLLFLVIICEIRRNMEEETCHEFGGPCGGHDHCSSDNFCVEGICLSKEDNPLFKELRNVDLVTPEKLYVGEDNGKVIITKTIPSFKWNYDPILKILSTNDDRFAFLNFNHELYLGSTSSELYLSNKDCYYYVKDDKGNYLFVDCSTIPWTINITLLDKAIKPLLFKERLK